MTAFLIVAAISAAVVLVFKYAVPRRKPDFSTGERLTKRALLRAIVELSKRCAVTHSGFGISGMSVKPRRVFSALEKELNAGASLGDWAVEAYRARNLIMSAHIGAKNAVRKSYSVGHVNGMPRLFLLCNELVGGTQADITAEKFNAAVIAFEQIAPLSRTERDLLTDMLRFCLCGYFYAVSISAISRADIYAKGLTDGATGKVDLDRITHGDYVCGLICSTKGKDKATVDRLLEINGIDADGAAMARREHLATTCAAVENVISSLIMLDEIDKGRRGMSGVLPLKLPDKAVLHAYGIAPVVLIAIAVALTCLYAPSAYCAVFVVSAIVVYVRFRLPIMIDYPQYVSPRLFFRLRLSCLFKRRKKSLPAVVRKPVEAVYVGDGKYYNHTVSSEKYRIDFDNFGRVAVSKRSDCGKPYKTGFLDLLFKTPSGTLSLSAFDLTVEPHKSVYRYAAKNVEIAAEFIAPVDCACCCCKLTVINRADKDIKVDISAVYSSRDVTALEPGNADKAAVANINGGVCALTFDGAAKYDYPISEIANEHDLHLAADSEHSLIGVRSLYARGFEKRCAILSVANGSSSREVARIAAYANDDGYFDYESKRAAVFCGLRLKTRACDYTENSNEKHKHAPRIECERNGAALSNVEYVCDHALGGYLNDGACVYDMRDKKSCRSFRHDLYDGCMGATFSQNGINGLYTNVIPDGITYSDGRIAENVPVSVVMSEDGLLWSPTALPLGKGELRATHGFSHVMYENAYNGYVSALKCYLARGKTAIVFDLTVENTANAARNIEVMFAVRPSLGAKATYDGKTVKVNDGAKSFNVVSSEQPRRCALYLEQYCSHGVINGTGDVTRAGSIVAPAVTVGVSLCPRGRSRVIFCIAATGENGISLTEINEAAADGCLREQEQCFGKMLRVKLKSDDARLNVMHARALYQAHVYGFLKRDALNPFDVFALLSAEKYVDKQAVKNAIISLLAEQSERGEYKNDARGALYIAFAAVDYATFAGDYGFFDELAEYMPRRVGGRRLTVKSTVAEHCMRALDANAAQREFVYDKNVRGIFDCKVYSELLRFFADLSNVSPERKDRYVALLGKGAATYADEIDKLKRRSLYALNSFRATFTCARLLFDAGEYDKAYNLLRFNNPVCDRGTGKYRQCSFFAENGQTSDGAVAAALYYTTVTECLAGLKLRDGKIGLNPRIGADAPHIRLELNTDDGRANIDVNNTERCGEWRIRLNRISYSAANVELNGRGDADILLYRTGGDGAQ